MKGEIIRFTAPLQMWAGDPAAGPAGFVVIPVAAAQRIAAHELHQRIVLGRRRGFGSVKVEARIGGSSWQTSVFPQKGGAGWFMAVKVSVRRAEKLEEGHEVAMELELI